MRSVFFSILLLAVICCAHTATAQQTDSTLRPGKETLKAADSVQPGKNNAHPDTLVVGNDTIKAISKIPARAPLSDSARRRRDAHRATIYSAVLPGAGQVYNKKYWKLPIVYAAIGIPAYLYFYNKSWYNKCQYALEVTADEQHQGIEKVDPLLVNFVNAGDANSIITYRDSFRKNQDYSVLFFLLFYGLQIVDATVDAHLKGFNVNSDLSMKVSPMIMATPTLVAGITMTFDLHKGNRKLPGMN